MRVVLLLGEDMPPPHAVIMDPHATLTLWSLPRDAKEGQAQRETPHSHLQTSLINHRDRETQTGAGGIDTGWRMLRAAEPQHIPRQYGHSPPGTRARHAAGTGEKRGKRIQSTSWDRDKSSI